jgi:hypothetical protein
MRLSRGHLPGLGLIVVASLLGARPVNAVNYNFNNGPEGWFGGNFNTVATNWVWDGAPTAGFWTVDGESRPLGDVSANYLYSPILCATKDGITIEVLHLFNFATLTGTSGTIPTGLGQLQYRVLSSGSGFQASPITYTGIVPTYPVTAPPTFPLEVGLAWEGQSPEFGSLAYKNTKGDIPLLDGDVFQVRFVNAHLGPYDPSYNPSPAWRINEVRFTNVVECVPEPGALALAAIGGVAALGLRLRRTRWTRMLGRSAFAGIVLALLAVACVLAVPPAAKADVLFDFQLSNGGWMKSHQGFVPSSFRWTYLASGTSSDPRWSVKAMGVDGVNVATANHLTSPLIDGLIDGQPSVNARISIAHNFLLPPSGTGGPRPISLGQMSYRLNNSGAWIGLPLSAFTSGGDLNVDDPVFGPSPFKSGTASNPLYVDQTGFVTATYLTPSGTAALPWVAPDGASFVGQSDGWSSLYVPSQAFLNIDTGLPASGITSLELRLTNANLGGNCDANEGWNVRMVQVDFSSEQPFVPEPEAWALAVMGGAGALAARGRFRRGSPPAFQAQ